MIVIEASKMTARRSVIAALGFMLWALPALSEEVAQPLTASEWVARRAMSRFSAYGEVCKLHMPGMTGAWERALANISDTVNRLTAEQLATSRFAELDKQSVPAARSAQLRRGIDGAQDKLKARLENQDPDATCPKFLRNAQGFDDDSIRPVVVDALAGFRALLVVPKIARPQ